MAGRHISDKSTFKVKFLGDYHDIVLNWNDEDEWQQQKQQLFNKLGLVTGIPKRCITEINLYNPISKSVNTSLYHKIRNGVNYPEVCKSQIDSAISYADGRFHLAFDSYFDDQIEHTCVCFSLIPERLVPEGVCRHGFCQHANTESFFNRIKDLINNFELNSQIWSHIQPLSSSRERREIYRKFNVLQYFYVVCNTQYPSAVLRRFNADKRLYLRARG